MVNDYHMLSGLQKVAILFSVVGESLAMSLIKGLSKTEVRKIRSTVRSMGTVSFLVKKRVMEEFYFGFLAEQDEAKEEGLMEGMKVSMARKMNHRVQLLPYNDSLYERIHYHVYQSVSLFSPTVEPKGINEFFLDMNGMRSINRSIKDAGLSIINRIENQIGISGIVGISANKLVSSIVTSVISDSIYEVEKGKESQFLSPLSPLLLPVAKENYVHRILKFLWIDHIGQIQSIAKQPDHFQIFFGRYASMLDKQSKGDDSSFVKPIEHKDHILEQTVLKRDTNDQVILYSVLRDLSDKIAFSLRQRKKLAKKEDL